jgi:1-acyl-sn-glycerol-3-phosphate acyltransferase
MTNLLGWTLKVLYSIYAYLVFAVLMLPCVPIIFLLSLLPGHVGGNMIYWLCRRIIDLSFILCGIWHTNSFDTKKRPQGPGVYVFNHISYLDALIVIKAIRNRPVRGLGKAEFGKIPLIGIVYRSMVIMVQRDDAGDRARSVADMKNFLMNNISVMMAPEGTFNETGIPLLDFYDGAFKIAIQTQTPLRPMLILDAYDRMHFRSAFSITPGKCRVVFLDEILVAGMDMENLPELKRKTHEIMQEGLVRYKATWIANQ